MFVELPQVGDTFTKGDEFGTVESVKAVSELYLPIGGEITAVNAELEEAPELVNNSPYEKGWMIEVKQSDKIKELVKEHIEKSKGREIPQWLIMDSEALKGTVAKTPSREEIVVPYNEQLIVELYSR